MQSQIFNDKSSGACAAKRYGIRPRPACCRDRFNIPSEMARNRAQGLLQRRSNARQ